MILLIAATNQIFSPKLSLLFYDTEEKIYGWVFNEEISQKIGDVNGVSGLSIFNDHLIVGYQCLPHKILIFDKNFAVVNSFELKLTQNLHSLLVYNNKIFTASTGTDEIIEITLDESFNLISEKVVWKFSDKTKRIDSHHVNSIGVIDNQMHCTCFGPRDENNRWRKAKNGKLINIETNKIVKENLVHPHSLFPFENSWMICEFGTGKIIFGNKSTVQLDGYVRGCSRKDNLLFIGSSGNRQISKSLGVLEENNSNDRKTLFSQIYVLDVSNFEVVDTISLENIVTEIYDIIILEGFKVPDNFYQHGNSLTKIVHMEKEILKLRGMISENRNKIGLNRSLLSIPSTARKYLRKLKTLVK